MFRYRFNCLIKTKYVAYICLLIFPHSSLLQSLDFWRLLYALLKQIHGHKWTESDAIGNLVSLAGCAFHLFQGSTVIGFVAVLLLPLGSSQEWSIL